MFRKKVGKRLPSPPPSTVETEKADKHPRFFTKRRVTFEREESPELEPPLAAAPKRAHPNRKVPKSNISAPPPIPTYSSAEIAKRLDLPSMKHTLQHSALGTELAAIFVFTQHHPLYPEKIFCHTNLSLLDVEEDAVDKEYPIFERYGDSRGAHSIFKFAGWARIVAVDLLEPESKELLDMLAMKWGKEKKQGQAWEESCKKLWAVITLEMIVGMLRDPMRD